MVLRGVAMSDDPNEPEQKDDESVASVVENSPMGEMLPPDWRGLSDDEMKTKAIGEMEKMMVGMGDALSGMLSGNDPYEERFDTIDDKLDAIMIILCELKKED